MNSLFDFKLQDVSRLIYDGKAIRNESVNRCTDHGSKYCRNKFALEGFVIFIKNKLIVQATAENSLTWCYSKNKVVLVV